MFERLGKEITIIIDNIINMVYYMRGAVDYDSALMFMSAGERDRISRFVNKHLESQSKSMHPIY